VDWKSGAAFFEAGANQIKVTFDDRSLPAKATWTDVTNGVNQGKFTGDPILFTDRTPAAPSRTS
jgi:hypothetical protein